MLGMIVNEKEALEHGAVTQFCRFYADEGLGQIEFCSLLNPPKPDALCKKDGEDLFVEVGHFYGTESDAKARRYGVLNKQRVLVYTRGIWS